MVLSHQMSGIKQLSFDLEYELMPSRNTPAALKTKAFVNLIKNIFILDLRHMEIQIKLDQL